jgi:hypothetical protein
MRIIQISLVINRLPCIFVVSIDFHDAGYLEWRARTHSKVPSARSLAYV